jgi:glucose/arabinose dehydrogenase
VCSSDLFLNINSLVSNPSNFDEHGLLGLAFHPDYANNGKFFLSYTTGPSGDHLISQFTRSAGDANIADRGSEQIVWGPYPHTTSGHKGGDIAFGPDGLLYASTGDGLAGGNGEGTRAQDLMDARGKLLRFDVDLPFPHIPTDNPYVGDPNALDEIFASGLRNPYRMGIDRVTGDVYLGDVGQSTREEINFIPGGIGGRNFGWKCKEGSMCFPNAPAGCVCANPAFTDPLHEYFTGTDGCAVIAGKVYRGSKIPDLYGWFLFTDFCTNRVQALRHDGTTITGYKDLSSQIEGATYEIGRASCRERV